MIILRETAGPAQESVWSFPRPAIAERCEAHLLIRHRGQVVAETNAGVRMLEAAHPPGYYFPAGDVVLSLLRPSPHHSLCEWKGKASYFDLCIAGEVLESVAWSYPNPGPGFALLQNHIAFYAAPFEACFVDGERVTPQPGGFYGGWITSRVVGPFKGVTGSRHW